MADIRKTRENPVEQFWEMTEEVAAGMLGVEGSGQHLQPMHPNCDRESGAIWFYTKKDSDLVQTVGQGGSRAHLAVVGKSHDYHACVAGRLSVTHDRAAIDRYWNTMTAAWFNSKDDPNLTMLKLELEDGVAWGSIGGARFGWEILKASMSTKEPDVGARQHFTFDSGRVAEMATGGDTSSLPRHVPRQEGQV